MSQTTAARGTIYVALQQFGEHDVHPLKLMQDAGFEVRRNPQGRRLQRDELLEELQDAVAVLAGMESYDAALLAALPTLRCISRCGVGTDGIDLDAARRRKIAVLTTPDEVVEPVAEMTIALILALARHIPTYCRQSASGQWRRHTGSMLQEWTVGLVGFGRIGRAIERYLRSFGPRVIVTDPALTALDVPEGVRLLPLRSLLAEADLVSLHAARPREAGPLLGKRELAMMKPGSRLVNTARGFLVDETALYQALVSGHLAAAALDVFGEEPYTGPLLKLPNVLCTPHAASMTKASRIAMEFRCAQHVVEFFAHNGSAARSEP